MIIKNKNSISKNKNSGVIAFLKNLFSIIFLFQIFIIFVLVVWYYNNPIKDIYSPSKILSIFSDKTKNIIGFEIKNTNKYLKTYFYSTYYSINRPKIEKIDIKISQKNIIELEFQRQNRHLSLGADEEIKKKLSKYVNGSIIFNDEEIPIKLRVKGDRKIHYDNIETTSYKVDLRKGNKIWGLEEFSLQKPIVRNYAYEYIFHKLHKELGNISLNYKVINLSINGLDKGVYSIEEGFSQELLERHGKRNGPIFGIRDDLSENYPNITYDSYSELYWVANNQDLLRSGYSILNSLKENSNNILTYVDWESWAKFFAVTDMVEAYHGALAKSVRVYYNPVSGKIEPISFDGHHGTSDFSNFIILDFMKETSECSWICNDKEWFLRFLLDHNNNPRKEFIEPYLKYLKVVSDEIFLQNFQKKYGPEINKLNKAFYSDFSTYDNILWRGIFPYVFDDEYLFKRSLKIKQKLNKNMSNFIFSKKENILNIKVARKSFPVKIVSDCDEIGEEKITFWVYETKNIFWPNDCKNLRIINTNDQMKNVFLFDNPVTDSSLPLNFKELPSLAETIKGDLIDNIFFPQDDIIFIHKDLKLQKDHSLYLRDNQKIILKNGSSLVLFGNVNIEASEGKEVLVEGEMPESGSIISIDNKFSAENLVLKNLTFPKVKGYILYGGLNIINSEVNLRNVVIMNSLSEDSLNLINSNSNLNNLKFINSQSDALDIDSGTANLNNIFCNKINNDCLDFSNANIEGNNIFANDVLDKSLSIGENSNVKINNIKINNSEIGLAVKDNSKAFIKSLNLQNVTLPLAVFVKKNEYGPAQLEITDFVTNNSNEIYLVDDSSKLKIEGKLYEGNEKGSVIESYLYGNKYGRATVR